ncbi:MAG TPA: hypothetical protein VM261_10255 [Kofleriaceae bacterium]|nr:hypothetical protein [Kofleriaceae bacterium]
MNRAWLVGATIVASTGFLVSGASFAVPGAASADSQPAPPLHAIGAITVGGSAPAPLGAALRSAATDGLTAGGAALVPPDTVARLLAAVPELASCDTADCHKRLANSVGATRLVTIAVDAKGELYTLAISLVDVQGRALRRRTDECIACAVPELQERVTTAVRDAVTATVDDTVAIVVDAKPAAASLVIDGSDRGATPWNGELVAGPHDATATDAGGASIRQQIFVEARPDQHITLEIPGASDRRRWGNLTYAAGGAGAVALLGGVFLLSMDGDGTCDVAGTCPRQYETTAGGLMSITVGLAALGTAGWMYWSDHRQERSLTVAATPGGAAATFRATF